MLRSINRIIGYKMSATDGDVGKCRDFLFDDENWTIRYMVADTGGWLTDRKTLISPISLGRPDWESSAFPVMLSKEAIEKSPTLDSHAPVSRQFEQQWYAHYSWPYYWQGGATWGSVPVPMQVAPITAKQFAAQRQEINESHLRSVNEVINYRIHATDDDIGHVEDLLVDDHDWRVRYMVIDTANWLPGRQVIVSPDWITQVKWEDSSVSIDLTKDGVEQSPTFEPHLPVNREYEAAIYDSHGKPVYW